MKTTTVIATFAATLLFLTAGSTLAAGGSGSSGTEAKRCYRAVHKLPYRVPTRCAHQNKTQKPVVPTPNRQEPQLEKKP
jgi:hypothetical protein